MKKSAALKSEQFRITATSYGCKITPEKKKRHPILDTLLGHKAKLNVAGTNCLNKSVEEVVISMYLIAGQEDLVIDLQWDFAKDSADLRVWRLADLESHMAIDLTSYLQDLGVPLKARWLPNGQIQTPETPTGTCVMWHMPQPGMSKEDNCRLAAQALATNMVQTGSLLRHSVRGLLRNVRV